MAKVLIASSLTIAFVSAGFSLVEGDNVVDSEQLDALPKDTQKHLADLVAAKLVSFSDAPAPQPEPTPEPETAREPSGTVTPAAEPAPEASSTEPSATPEDATQPRKRR